MRKIISILSVMVLFTTISFNIVISKSNKLSFSNLNILTKNMVANAEDPAVPGYFYMIDDCIVCTPGEGSCYVSIQCCYNQEPYCPDEW